MSDAEQWKAFADEFDIRTKGYEAVRRTAAAARAVAKRIRSPHEHNHASEADERDP